MSERDDLLDRAAGVRPGEVPRALVVFAHPDDEILAIGGQLERWRNAVFVTATDGAPADGADARQHGFASLQRYREARRQELHRAFADAALPLSLLRQIELEDGSPIPDQQAALSLVELTRAVARLYDEVRPEVVVTHPYEGGHPDHDACAFAVHTAARVLGRGDLLIVEAPSYHAGPNGIVTGEFLPYSGTGGERQRVLSSPEQQAKLRRLACFASQQETLALFGCEVELMREAPAYDFLQAPHAGELFYEQFPWGMTGARFRELAASAAAALHQQEATS